MLSHDEQTSRIVIVENIGYIELVRKSDIIFTCQVYESTTTTGLTIVS